MVVQWWGVIPFVLLLGCIAVAPLLPRMSEYWEHQRVQLLVSLVLGLPVAIWFLASGEGSLVTDALIEYAQFIVLLLGLFVISGGIFLSGDIRATPRNNTIFLAVGGVLASFIGTTGAAMLLIRPLLNTNAERKHKAHSVIFCIFIVANCGGLLTPLGDPPLFLGMLRGVPFTWTFGLFPMWFLVNVLLLALYHGLDTRAHAREAAEDLSLDKRQITPLGLLGGIHLLYLAGVVLAVAFAPSIHMTALEDGTASAVELIPWREIVILLLCVLSLRTGKPQVRYVDNNFRWGPIQEVAALFIGIFLTMIPALQVLARVAPRLPLNEVTFYLFTGGLSSVLDNAPTYLTFFEMARELGGEPMIAGVHEPYLVAISLGAVFGGAMSYIGNGPNFMVKAVADHEGVRMPSFGGYVAQAAIHLLPILIAVPLIFLTQSLWSRALGVLLAAAVLGYAVLLSWRHRSSVPAL